MRRADVCAPIRNGSERQPPTTRHPPPESVPTFVSLPSLRSVCGGEDNEVSAIALFPVLVSRSLLYTRRYGLGNRGIRFRFQAGTGEFPALHSKQAGSGAQPEFLILGVQQLEREVHQLHLVSELTYLHSPYAFVAWRVVKHGEISLSLPI